MTATLAQRTQTDVLDVDVAVTRCRREGSLGTLVLDWPEQFARVRAGQFVMLKSLARGAPLLPRPLSLVPAPDGLFIAFNIVGDGTRLLAQTRPGDFVTLIGPLGNGFNAPDAPIAIVVDAPHAGTMLALAHERAGAGERREADTVFYVTDPRRPHASDGPLLEAFSATGARLEVVAPGELSKPLQAFPYVAAGVADSVMAEVQRVARAAGLSGEASLQAAMACGLGVCQVCIHPSSKGAGFLVCDGPVFPLDQPQFPAAA